MHRENEPGNAGLRATAIAMFRSRRFLARFGKDTQQLALVEIVGAAAAFFPFDGAAHPLYGCLLLITSVVSYVLGAILISKNGG